MKTVTFYLIHQTNAEYLGRLNLEKFMVVTLFLYSKLIF